MGVATRLNDALPTTCDCLEVRVAKVVLVADIGRQRFVGITQVDGWVRILNPRILWQHNESPNVFVPNHTEAYLLKPNLLNPDVWEPVAGFHALGVLSAQVSLPIRPVRNAFCRHSHGRGGATHH